MPIDKKNYFSSTFGSILVAASSAIGLGNIWKFPTIVGTNGGAAFIIIYILACVIIILPLMIAEFYIGHKTKTGIIESFRQLAPNTKWYLIGYLSIFSAVLIGAFYSDVVGWLLIYIQKLFTGNIITTSPNIANATFNEIISRPILVGFYQILTLLISAGILCCGIKNGLEKTIKFVIPLILIILIILAINGLFTPKTKEALLFLFRPDFSKITITSVLLAIGLAFFKLSVGSAIMTTYASYFPQKISLPNVALKIMIIDLFISLLAGMAIFPIIFSNGFDINVGPSLLFVTIISLFSRIKFGVIFIFTFLLLCFLLSLGAILSLMEALILNIISHYKLSRNKAILITFFLYSILGLMASLSLTPILQNIKIFDKTFFDLFDFTSSNILMPISGVFTCLFFGYKLKKEDLEKYFTEIGTKNKDFIDIWYNLLRYISPLIIVIVLIIFNL